MNNLEDHFNFSEICRSLGKDRTSIKRNEIPNKFKHRFEVLYDFMEEWIITTKKYD